MFAQTPFPSATRPPLRKPPPLDFAQLIAQRRAGRVAQNTQMEANTNHFWNLKNSIELENAFQEKERMSSYLRLGQVPAHISHPIVDALRAGAVRRPMEVDEDVVIDGLVQPAPQRSPNTKHMAAATRKTLREGVNKIPHMEDFTPDEHKIALPGLAGQQARHDNPEAIVSRNIKMRARNAQTRLAFANTDARRAA